MPSANLRASFDLSLVSPKRLFTNLFGRDLSHLERRVLPSKLSPHTRWSASQVAVYIAGFPCRAFSRLRWKSDFLADPEARQFFEVLRTMRGVQPAAAWLNGC